MSDIGQIIEAGRIGLAIEQLRAAAAATNISGSSSSKVEANFQLLLDQLAEDVRSGSPIANAKYDQDILESHVVEVPSSKIDLDVEARRLADAEQRYQVIAELMTKRMAIKQTIYRAGGS